MNSSSAHAEMDKIAQEFKQYAYTVSHDLGAPVRAMVEFSRLLTAEHPNALGDESKLYLSLIVENGENLQRMMQGLLDYSRINTLAIPPSRVDCNALLSYCRQVMQNKIAPRSGTLDFSNLPDITADKEQMTQLFLILLDNAFKFTTDETRPHVIVSAKITPDHYIFSVADNGIGIDSRFREKIFQPFQRLHTSEEYPGMGMGLALAKRIVVRHGGEIWVESDGENGSIFLFTLPVKGILA